MTAELVHVVTGDGITLPVEPLVVDLVRQWLDDPGFSPLTRRAYEQDMRAFIGWLASRAAGELIDLLGVTRADVEAFLVSERARGMGVATISRRRAALSSFFTRCEQEERITRNPCAFVKVAPLDKSGKTPNLSLEEARALLAAARADGPKSFLLVSLGLALGLRCAEICGLTWESITTTDRGTSRISVLGKGGKTVQVPIPSLVEEALYLQEHSTGPLLRQAWDPTRALDTSSAATILARLGRAAGITRLKVTPHMLRVTAVTELVRAGTPLDVAQGFARHQSVETTLCYIRRASDDSTHPVHAAAALFGAPDTASSPETGDAA